MYKNQLYESDYNPQDVTIIIMDFEMPELSGPEVIKEIQSITHNMNEQLISQQRHERIGDLRINTH
jgi:CheY-like chemotaxis protein